MRILHVIVSKYQIWDSRMKHGFVNKGWNGAYLLSCWPLWGQPLHLFHVYQAGCTPCRCRYHWMSGTLAARWWRRLFSRHPLTTDTDRYGYGGYGLTVHHPKHTKWHWNTTSISLEHHRKTSSATHRLRSSVQGFEHPNHWQKRDRISGTEDAPQFHIRPVQCFHLPCSINLHP